jgi:hypothetical protein
MEIEINKQLVWSQKNSLSGNQQKNQEPRHGREEKIEMMR